MTGGFFGSKPPKAQVSLNGSEKAGNKISCKIVKPLPYANAKGKAGKSCMDITTGSSRVIYILKKKIDESTSPTLELKFDTGQVEKLAL